MFATLSDIIKIPLAVVIGIAISAVALIFFYEGLRLPLIGQVIDGRVQTAVKDATKDTVASFRLDAALAQLDRERRDRETAEKLNTEAQRRQQAADAARSTAEAALAARIAADTSPDGAVWTQEDINWSKR